MGGRGLPLPHFLCPWAPSIGSPFPPRARLRRVQEISRYRPRFIVRAVGRFETRQGLALDNRGCLENDRASAEPCGYAGLAIVRCSRQKQAAGGITTYRPLPPSPARSRLVFRRQRLVPLQQLRLPTPQRNLSTPDVDMLDTRGKLERVSAPDYHIRDFPRL